jgi:pimeloyl-ACP methyl ester carboxylesterase
MKERIVKIKSSSGRILDGTIIEKGEGVNAIFFHGMTSSQDGYVEIAEMLNVDGTFLAVSLSGHGKSDGCFNKLNVNDLMKDGLAVYDWLRDKVGDDKQVVIIGTSVGAAIATNVAHEKKVAGLVLRAPAMYTAEMRKLGLGELMKIESRIFQSAEKFSDELPKYNGKLLVVTSENDPIIPKWMSERYLQMANDSSEFVIKGAVHQLNENDRKEFVRAMDSFLNEMQMQND